MNLLTECSDILRETTTANIAFHRPACMRINGYGTVHSRQSDGRTLMLRVLKKKFTHTKGQWHNGMIRMILQR